MINNKKRFTDTIKKSVTICSEVISKYYQQVLLIAFGFSLWMMLEDILLPVIHRICEDYIVLLSEVWLGIVLVLLIFCISVFLLCRNRYIISRWGVASLLLISLLYSYYRFFSDEFLFFGGKYVYYMDVIYVILFMCVLSNIIVYIKNLATRTSSSAEKICLLRDDALDDSTQDILDYDVHVTDLSNLLDTVDVSKRAYSVGIVGEWGIGKSTFLNIFAKSKINAGQIVVRFNPRSAKRVELIQEEFFTQFRSELSRYHSGIGIRIDKYAYALQLTTPTKWLYACWDFFANWSASSEKNGINTTIQLINRNIYVIIEDLDRLSGAEILEVLKLIDANGNFQRTYFLGAYDKTYVNVMLRNILNYGDTQSDFTDKYFQYEYPLSKLRNDQLIQILEKNVYDWVLSIVPEVDSKHVIHEWRMICLHLINNLPTIRHIKRYTNLLRSSYVRLKDKVVFSDFALITLVRFLDIDAYWSIYYQHYITNVGRHDYNDYYGLRENFEAQAAKYSRIVGFESILRSLFDTSGIRQFEEYNRICRVEAFANYFYEMLPNKLYFQEQNQLMDINLFTEEAINRLSAYLQNEKYRTSIIEFLYLYNVEWIGNSQRLYRYICLVMYANAICNSQQLYQRYGRFFEYEIADRYIKHALVKDIEEYKEILMDALQYMMAYIPLAIGIFMVHRLYERRVSDYYETNIFFTKEDDVHIALSAQRHYDDLYGTGDWDAWESLRIANISIADNKTLVGDAQNHLNRMLDAYPDEYARKLLVVSDVSVSKKKYSHVEIRDCIHVISMIGGHDRFKEWMTHIHSEYLKEIFQILYQELYNSNSARLRIPYVPNNRYGDYAFILDRIKTIPSATVEEL